MKIGTQSVLYGAHCFFLHPLFVFRAWWILYGFPVDPRLWVAFFVHDLGYWGKPNMDGEEGEKHPYWGARVMGNLFGKKWYYFTLLHSRYLSKKLSMKPSRLCIADKLAIALTPHWLYLPMVRATGEIYEYLSIAASGSRDGFDKEDESVEANQLRWYLGVQRYMRRWVDEHKDGKEDTWTKDDREPDEDGVWA